jgi:peptide chain release factor 1
MAEPIKQQDERNAVIEIVPGIGGRESHIWADDVREMLTHYAKRLAFQVEEFGHLHGSSHLIIKGRGAYSVFQFEAGIHEVQRVPITDHHGRVHSSTAIVIVLPEINERELSIQQSDLKIETFQGADSIHPGVLITHKPSGIQVAAQSSKEEQDNINNAMRLLRARLYHLDQSNRKRGLRLMRKEQRATGQRSERIRTYNYKEGRVRDHRTGLKSMQLKQIMDGRLEQFTVAMRAREQRKQEQQQAPIA